LIKQVVVRGDESIVGDLISNGFKAGNSANDDEMVMAYAPVSGDAEISNNLFSLKRRVGAAIASEEKKLIAEVLNKTNWNRRKAADLLEISYRSLLYKIKEYSLNSSK